MVTGGLALALIVIARIALGLMFLASAIGNFGRFAMFEQLLAEKRLPQPWLLIRVAVAVEAIGAGLLILSLWPAVGAALLIGFTVVGTYVFHDFWQRTGEERRKEIDSVLTNTAIVGGLLLAIVTG
ncbi:MAG: DoxX family protein [Bauldia sp.]